ncbi:hypothetical protein [Endozoicomonas sp. ALD040]|uniref:hypothetical protein n=1 Tax=unclassified Endozoicomonas TaxID=2644528 RepID=UPI003BAE7587
MSFPALPSSVDRYVREILNRLLGRTGAAGDAVVLRRDLVQLGLAGSQGQNLELPASSDYITQVLQPVEGLSIPDKPTTPEGLKVHINLNTCTGNGH